MTTYRTYPSGAIRADDTGKGHHELLSPFVFDLLAKHLEKGAKDHGPRNWEKGMPLSTYARRVWRHFMQWMMGKDDEDHLVAAFCNLHMAIHEREMIRLGIHPPELDDMPHYYKGKQWPSADHAEPSPCPIPLPNGKPDCKPPHHAPKLACSNTHPAPTSWWRKMTAKAGSTLTRWALATR